MMLRILILLLLFTEAWVPSLLSSVCEWILCLHWFAMKSWLPSNWHTQERSCNHPGDQNGLPVCQFRPTSAAYFVSCFAIMIHNIGKSGMSWRWILARTSLRSCKRRHGIYTIYGQKIGQRGACVEASNTLTVTFQTDSKLIWSGSNQAKKVYMNNSGYRSQVYHVDSGDTWRPCYMLRVSFGISAVAQNSTSIPSYIEYHGLWHMLETFRLVFSCVSIACIVYTSHEAFVASTVWHVGWCWFWTTCIRACVQQCVHNYACLCARVCWCAYVHRRVRKCVHVHMHARARTHTHTCVC